MQRTEQTLSSSKTLGFSSIPTRKQRNVTFLMLNAIGWIFLLHCSVICFILCYFVKNNNNNRNTFEHQCLKKDFHILGNVLVLLRRNEKIDTTLMSVCCTWSYSQKPVSLA